MRKRTISVGRRQVNGDAGCGDPISSEDVITSLQSKLQVLEHKYAAFVSRCISMLKERKALLTTRLSGEGGVVDDGFRREISELSKEKDRLEEDLQYMLDLKETSQRKAGQAKPASELLKTIEKLCVSARDQAVAIVQSALPEDLISPLAEMFLTLQKALQSVLAEYSTGKSQQIQGYLQQVKAVQGDKAGVEKHLGEVCEQYETQLRHLKKENAELEEQVRDLVAGTRREGLSASPMRGDESIDSPHFISSQPSTRATEASFLQSPNDADVSRLKRKLIAVSKERDLLKVWKQNHVSMPPPAIAMMQQLRSDLAKCTERCHTLKTYYSEKLKTLSSAAGGYLTASERMITSGRRDGGSLWEQSKSALVVALQSSAIQPKDFDSTQSSRHAGVQTTADLPEDPSPQLTERSKLLARLKSVEDAMRHEQSEVGKVAKAKAEFEAQNSKLTLQVTELRRAVDQLNSEKHKLIQLLEDKAALQGEPILDKGELLRFKDLCVLLEKEKKLAIDKWQSEKNCCERLRDSLAKERESSELTKEMLGEVSETSLLQIREVWQYFERLQADIQRISTAVGDLKAIKGHFRAAKTAFSQEKESGKAHIASLQTQIKAKETDLLRFQSRLSEFESTHQQAVCSRNKELIEFRTANEALQTELQKLLELNESNQERILELEGRLEDSKSVVEDLEGALRSEKEVSCGLLEELQNVRKQIAAMERSTPRSRESEARLIANFEKDKQELKLHYQKLASDEQANLNKAMEEQRKNADNVITALTTKLEDARTTAESEVETLHEEKSALEKEIAAAKLAEKEAHEEIDRISKEMNAKCEHFEEEKIDLESYINAQNKTIQDVEKELQSTNETLEKTAEQLSAIEKIVNSESEAWSKATSLSECLKGLIQSAKDGKEQLRQKEKEMETIHTRVKQAISTFENMGKIELSHSLEAMIEGFISLAQTSLARLRSENESLKLSKQHLIELMTRLDIENESLVRCLEHISAESEDIRAQSVRATANLTAYLASKEQTHGAQMEDLFRTQTLEKLELIATHEAECQYFRRQASSRSQVIAAENVTSDVEIEVGAEDEFEDNRESVPIEIETAAEAPSFPFTRLQQLITEFADRQKIEVCEAVETLATRILTLNPSGVSINTKHTQTSMKYHDPGSYLSMEEEISAVAGALNPHDEYEGNTESFEQVDKSPLGLGNLPSFEVSMDLADELETPKSHRLPELPFHSSVVRNMQTEPQQDFSAYKHCRTLERDLEDEVRTNKLMQQQIQLLKEEIQQKDRQLMRKSTECKPLLSPEVLSDAFVKLVKSLPQL